MHALNAGKAAGNFLAGAAVWFHRYLWPVLLAGRWVLSARRGKGSLPVHSVGCGRLPDVSLVPDPHTLHQQVRTHCCGSGLAATIANMQSTFRLHTWSQPLARMLRNQHTFDYQQLLHNLVWCIK